MSVVFWLPSTFGALQLNQNFMKKTVFKYGLYSGLAISVLGLAGFTLGKGFSYSVQEVIGYVTMVIATSFVFFGIKHYRDKENNGAVSFGKALLLGILITLFAALAFAVIDYLYTTVIHPNFADEYIAYSLENLKNSVSAEEFETKKAGMQAQFKAYTPGFMAAIMFATVFVIGFIMSLISAVILQKKA